MDMWVASPAWLLRTRLPWTRVGKTPLFSILVDTYSGVRFLDHGGILFLVFKGHFTLFFTAAAPIYIPTDRAQGAPFLLSSPTRVNFCFFGFWFLF